jgi:hypothetical protein
MHARRGRGVPIHRQIMQQPVDQQRGWHSRSAVCAFNVIWAAIMAGQVLSSAFTICHMVPLPACTVSVSVHHYSVSLL